MILGFLRGLRRLALRLAPAWHPTRNRCLRGIIAVLVAWFRPAILRTRHGFTLRIPRGDGSPIVQALYLDGEYEPEESEVVREILRPGDVAVDVGANVGYMTCLMALAVGEQGEVHSFEPEPVLSSTLAANLELNRIAWAQVRRVALSDRASDSELYLSPSNPGDHTLVPLPGRTKIKIVTDVFDDYWRQQGQGRRVRLAKVDVQGHELEVLRGMERSLQNGVIEHLLIEVWPYRLRRAGASCKEVLDRLSEGMWKRRVLSATGCHFLPSLAEIQGREAEWTEMPDFVFNLLAKHVPQEHG